MQLRVLIVESDPEELLFLEEVVIEVEDGRHWNQWLDLETQGASTCAETLAILNRDPVDVVLLNPDLVDSNGAATFRRIHSAVPQVPVILLVEAADRALAVQLIREGVQDFIIKKQLDCAYLAHAVRNAMERQRRLEAIRSTTMTDPLTGLLNRGAFLSLAERDRKLAEALERRLLLILAEPKDAGPGDMATGIAAAAGDHARDLAMVSAGDVLRGLAGHTGLLARVEETRFGLALFDTRDEPVEAAWKRIHVFAAAHRIEIGAAIFEPELPVTLEILLERAESDLQAAPLTASAAAVRR
jgi:PleD family two-component response regulator